MSSTATPSAPTRSPAVPAPPTWPCCSPSCSRRPKPRCRPALLAAYRSGNPGPPSTRRNSRRPSPAPARRAWPTISTSACAIAACSSRAARLTASSPWCVRNFLARAADPDPDAWLERASPSSAAEAPRWRGSKWMGAIGHQALQHQGPRSCAVAQLATEPRLAFLAGRASPALSRHRHAAPPGADRAARSARCAARPG
jgi:hypothetical protein